MDMGNVHIIGGWWIVFFVLPFIFWRRSGWGRYRSSRDAPRSAELEESIRERLQLVDQLEARVAELENRLDFTERLLSDRKESKIESH
jgi:hypothetical protein